MASADGIMPYSTVGCRAPRASMDLLEYQGKQLFAKHGVPVPSGEVAATVDDAVAAAARSAFPARSRPRC